MKFQIHNRYFLIGLHLTAYAALTLVGLFLLTPQPAAAQTKEQVDRVAKVARDRGNEMLKAIKSDLKDNYYDITFHGMDLEARFKAAQEKIKTAPTDGQVNSIIAQVLVELNDSHTYFLPPGRLVSVDYGWRMQLIGDKCFVVSVKRGSDAAAKGLKVGDLVYSIDGYEPTRENFWKIEYSYFVLKPRTRTNIVITEPNGTLRTVEVTVKLSLFGHDLSAEGLMEERAPKKSKDEEKKEKERKEEERKKQREERALLEHPRYHEASKDLIICQLPEFILTDDEVDAVVKKISPYQNLILDLRGNPGGYVKALQRFVGYFFDHDIKIADRKGRRRNNLMIAKMRKEHQFKGRLVVLIDGDSASAAEIFARVVQLEKRGVVIGDRSSGKVMEGRRFPHVFDQTSKAMMYGYYIIASWNTYGTTITSADVIMADGKSIEHIGVTPNELLLPTGPDLAARRDPVLARAAAILGFEIDSKKAGSLFPSERSTEVVTDDPDKPVEVEDEKDKN